MIQRRKFFKNALWLTLTSTLLRLVGMAYRIFIGGKLGEAGMGLYQLVLSVYMLASTFATAGIGVAVTRLVSEQCAAGNAKNTRRIMRFCIRWGILIGALIGGIFLVGADGIATHLIRESRMAQGLRVLSTGLPFMAVSATLNGYFLARSRVRYTCIAQVIEQIVRITLVVFLIDRFLQNGTEYGIIAVFIGNAVSEVASAAVLYLFYRSDLKGLETVSFAPFAGTVFARFISIAFPIAATKYITGGLHALENLLVPRQIEKFTGSADAALSDFGALKGMALPLVMFPSSFLISIASLLIPELSAAMALRKYDDIKYLTEKALRITFALSVFMGGLFHRFADPLGQILYHSESVGEILRFLSPVVPFMYLDCITDGLLKGMGQQYASLRYNTVDSAIRISLVLGLVPFQGLRGFLWIMVISNVGVSLLGLRRLIKVTDCPFPFKALLLPVIGIALSEFGSGFLRGSSLSALITGGIVYAGIYFLFILSTSCKEIRLAKNRRS